MNVKPLFKLMVDKKASDLFFTTFSPVMIKIDGKIMPVNQVELSPKMVRQAALELMNETQLEQFTRDLEIDFAISEPGLGRFRVNVFHQRGNVAMVLRFITPEMPQLEELGLPEILKDMIMLRRGLILMVGASGSGKSTTLAAMIDFRNKNSASHIVTIEDPIEFLHTQSEVDRQSARGRARHALVPSRAAQRDARGAGRDPDRRDPRPRDDGGRDRPRRHGPPRARDAAREQLARDARPHHQHVPARPAQADADGPVAVPARDHLAAAGALKEGKRVAAVEVMLNTPHIQEMILKGDVGSVKEAIKDTREPGMQSFDQALLELYRKGAISMEEALSNADSRSNLEAKINFS